MPLARIGRMGIILVVGVVVVAVLLWRILKVQTARNEIETVRVQVEAVNVGMQIARTLVERIEQHRGGYQKAKDEGKLIEWIDDVARMLNANDDAFWLQLRAPASAATLEDLIAESFVRGIPCRFLEPRDYEDRLLHGYPGRSAPADLTCPESCIQTYDIDLPLGTKICPFCGEAWSPGSDETCA